MKIKFWGVRGSIPTPGYSTLKIGGNTSCVEIRAGDELIIIDGGSGLRLLGESLLKEIPLKGMFLFSHYHWDHIQGFPFFSPAYIKENEFQIFGGNGLSYSLQKSLFGQMDHPNFPIELKNMGSKMVFHELLEGEEIIKGGVKISNTFVNHPSSSLAYRIDHENKSFVYSSDTEHLPDGVDQKLLKFAKGADIIVYDAQYTPEEYEGTHKWWGSRKGWGHSTMIEGVKLAKAAGIKKLVLSHHDPSRDDDAIARIEKEAQRLFPNSIAAYEGLEIYI